MTRDQQAGTCWTHSGAHDWVEHTTLREIASELHTQRYVCTKCMARADESGRVTVQ